MSSPATPTTPPPTRRRRRAVTSAGGEEGKSGEGREEGEEAGGGYFGNMASCLVRYSPNMPFSVPIFSFSFNMSFLVAGNVPSFWVTCRQRMSCAVIELRSTSY